MLRPLRPRLSCGPHLPWVAFDAVDPHPQVCASLAYRTSHSLFPITPAQPFAGASSAHCNICVSLTLSWVLPLVSLADGTHSRDSGFRGNWSQVSSTQYQSSLISLLGAGPNLQMFIYKVGKRTVPFSICGCRQLDSTNCVF